MKLTQEELDKVPYFINHKSARYFFKECFGSHFKMTGTEMVDGEKVYQYHLVEDKEAYIIATQKQEGFATAEETNCYQPVEITEDGKVRVLY